MLCAVPMTDSIQMCSVETGSESTSILAAQQGCGTCNIRIITCRHDNGNMFILREYVLHFHHLCLVSLLVEMPVMRVVEVFGENLKFYRTDPDPVFRLYPRTRLQF